MGLSATNIFRKLTHENNYFDFRLQLLNLKLRAFKPKHVFYTEFNDFYIKTVETPAELREVLKLRHDIFFKERLGSLGDLVHNDFDRYDLLGDHLLLKHKETNQTIGTYRIICSSYSRQFYTQTEFEIEKLLNAPGVKIELSRACIKKEFRNSMAIYLIWKGLARYATLTGAKYMFGISSVDSLNPFIVNAIHQYLQNECPGEDFEINPLPKYQMEEGKEKTTLALVESSDKLIPPLLRSYINAGAKIYGEPAIDKDMQTSDFFTILDLEKLPSRYIKKFF